MKHEQLTFQKVKKQEVRQNVEESNRAAASIRCHHTLSAVYPSQWHVRQFVDRTPQSYQSVFHERRRRSLD